MSHILVSQIYANSMGRHVKYGTVGNPILHCKVLDKLRFLCNTDQPNQIFMNTYFLLLRN